MVLQPTHDVTASGQSAASFSTLTQCRCNLLTLSSSLLPARAFFLFHFLSICSSCTASICSFFPPFRLFHYSFSHILIHFLSTTFISLPFLPAYLISLLPAFGFICFVSICFSFDLLPRSFLFSSCGWIRVSDIRRLRAELWRCQAPFLPVRRLWYDAPRSLITLQRLNTKHETQCGSCRTRCTLAFTPLHT